MNRSKNSSGVRGPRTQPPAPETREAFVTKLKAAAKKIQVVFEGFEKENRVIETRRLALENKTKKELDRLAKGFGYKAYHGLAGAIAQALAPEDHGRLRINSGPRPVKPAKVASVEPVKPTDSGLIDPKLRERLLQLQSRLS